MIERSIEARAEAVKDYFRKEAIPFGDDASLDKIAQRAKGARRILLGKDTHGTGDFYLGMGLISQRIIESQGASFVAIEWDWPDCLNVDDYVTADDSRFDSARDALLTFSRFPQWMWVNEEMLPFIEWLRQFNLELPKEERIRFYGLDVQNDESHSINAALTFIESRNSKLATLLRKAEGQKRVEEVSGSLNEVSRSLSLRSSLGLSHALISALHEQAILDGTSWARDEYMYDLANVLMELHGGSSRGIFWMHNTHVGDGAFTSENEINLGTLAREKDKDAFIIGFGTDRGTVISARSWGEETRQEVVPPSREQSWGNLLNSSVGENSLIIFDQDQADEDLLEMRDQRAIGAEYDPDFEYYVGTQLTKRYDAFVFMPETNAATPL